MASSSSLLGKDASPPAQPSQVHRVCLRPGRRARHRRRRYFASHETAAHAQRGTADRKMSMPMKQSISLSSVEEISHVKAPLGMEAANPAVEPLVTLDGTPVAVRHRNQIAAAFHPELDPDNRFYEAFFKLTG